MRDLNNKFLEKIDSLYQQNKNNKLLESAIKNAGINKICLNNEIVNKTRREWYQWCYEILKTKNKMK